MTGKKDEVIKETEIILRQLLIDQKVDVNLGDSSQEKSIPNKQATVSEPNDTPSIPTAPADVLGGQQDQSYVDPVGQEALVDSSDNQAMDNSDEATQDPPEIEIIAEMIAKEMGEVGKGDGNGEKGQEDVNT